jgi:hypothetical protein
MISNLFRGALVIGAWAFAATVSANTPGDVRDLVDARASSGSMELERRGYVHISSQKGADRAWGMWWNPATRTCVSVATVNGRFGSLTTAPDIDCNQSGHGTEYHGAHEQDDGASGAAIALGAAAVLGAIALAHKSHHHDDNRHHDDHAYENDFERGHNDGLYNHHFDNYNNSSAYADGYRSGVEQRDHDSAYRNHSGRYDRGYEPVGVQSSEFADLNGRNKRNAHQALRDWGFDRVDTMESGSTEYTIWYKRRTGQCVQIAEADGRALDVRGIGRHPACR